MAASVAIHLCLECTEQDERTLPARFRGGTQKVAGPGESRPMRQGAHLCGMQGVLYIHQRRSASGKVGLRTQISNSQWGYLSCSAVLYFMDEDKAAASFSREETVVYFVLGILIPSIISPRSVCYKQYQQPGGGQRLIA